MRNITLWMKRKSQVHKDVYNGHNQILKLLISGREVKENEFKASEKKKKKIKEKKFKVENSPHKPSKLIAFPFDNLFVYIFFINFK